MESATRWALMLIAVFTVGCATQPPQSLPIQEDFRTLPTPASDTNTADPEPHAAVDIDPNDPFAAIVPPGSYMGGYCRTPKRLCFGSSDSLEQKFAGMKGMLTSLEPVKRDYRDNIFEFTMANGENLYYSTEADSPFSGKFGAPMRLSEYEEILSQAGEPVIEGGVVRVEDVVFSDGIGFKYLLSTGYEIWGDRFEVLKAFLPNVPREREEDFVRMIDNLRVKHDEVEDRFFVSIDDESPLDPYVGYADGKAWLRFKLYYEADDWLFAHGALVKADDTKVEMQRLGFKRDHTGGTIWEWHDRTAQPSDIELLKKVIASESAVVRFYGRQYYGDREISAQQKRYLANILSVYDMLN